MWAGITACGLSFVLWVVVWYVALGASPLAYTVFFFFLVALVVQVVRSIINENEFFFSLSSIGIRYRSVPFRSAFSGLPSPSVRTSVCEVGLEIESRARDSNSTQVVDRSLFVLTFSANILIL